MIVPTIRPETKTRDVVAWQLLISVRFHQTEGRSRVDYYLIAPFVVRRPIWITALCVSSRVSVGDDDGRIFGLGRIHCAYPLPTMRAYAHHCLPAPTRLR